MSAKVVRMNVVVKGESLEIRSVVISAEYKESVGCFVVDVSMIEPRRWGMRSGCSIGFESPNFGSDVENIEIVEIFVLARNSNVDAFQRSAKEGKFVRIDLFDINTS
jgi:hypothetical protein